jgi:hypothetical protein
MTPQFKYVYDYVKSKYGLHIGVTNCRKISGSQTYSQHSWSNAGDIYTTDKNLHDEISVDLRATFGSHINNILTWRYNDAHWNHVHVDMWPKGWLTPPCVAGGPNKIKYKDGTVVEGPFPDLIGDDMAILTEAEQLELRKFLQYIKDAKSNVGFVTQSIGDIRERNTYGPWLPKADYVPGADLPTEEIVKIVRDV